MRNFTMLFLALMIAAGMSGQTLPMASPNGKIIQDVGLTQVEIEYNRPGVKDRTIFGDMIPYGEMWRTGANKATRLSFSTDVRIEGKNLPAGDYSFFTIPGKDRWTLVFNNETELWGTGNYSQDDDALRIVVDTRDVAFTETMTFDIGKITNSGAEICLSWERTAVCFNLEVDVIEMADRNIAAAINDIENPFRVYHNAARWYLETGQDPAKALDWAKKSAENRETFWNVMTLSRAYAANGQYDKAIKSARRSIELSKETGNTAYVIMNEANIADWEAKK